MEGTKIMSATVQAAAFGFDDHPPQILRSKADDPVAGLPFQNLTVRDSMVDVVGTGALDLPDPLTDVERGRNAHS